MFRRAETGTSSPNQNPPEQGYLERAVNSVINIGVRTWRMGTSPPAIPGCLSSFNSRATVGADWHCDVSPDKHNPQAQLDVTHLRVKLVRQCWVDGNANAARLRMHTKWRLQQMVHVL